MLSSDPGKTVIGNIGGPGRFAPAVTSETGKRLQPNVWGKIVTLHSRYLGYSIGKGSIAADDNRQNVVVPEIEIVEQVRTERMVPVEAIGEIIVGLPEPLVGNLLRENRLVVSERAEIVHSH